VCVCVCVSAALLASYYMQMNVGIDTTPWSLECACVSSERQLTKVAGCAKYMHTQTGTCTDFCM